VTAASPRSVFEIADAYVDAFAALDPVEATDYGIAGHEAEMTNYSPEGIDARAELDRSTLAALAEAPRDTDRDRVAAEAIAERLAVRVDQQDAGERLRDLRIIGSPVQGIRQCFDLMPYDSPHDWEIAAERLGHVPAALESFRRSLEEGVRRDVVAARRQSGPRVRGPGRDLGRPGRRRHSVLPHARRALGRVGKR
jgi:uncharacterized protein (DUF885 family)